MSNIPPRDQFQVDPVFLEDWDGEYLSEPAADRQRRAELKQRGFSPREIREMPPEQAREILQNGPAAPEPPPLPQSFASTKVELTLFTKQGGPLTKVISLAPDGTLNKDGSAGTAEMLCGAWRIGLDGRPYGSVTKSEEDSAKARLAAMAERARRRKEAEQAVRLRASIADLRKTGRRRAAAQSA
jgi:hypothetical protein